ncbi:MAG TPA: glycosyltransferase [Chitinophagaceae bacterium]|nr:glycosyltransferase [Chitinophagaceae bacterium]
MKIALIHDWLRVNAGSEKVIKEIIALFKDEDLELFTLFNKLSIIDKKEIIGNTKTHFTWLQHLPYIERIYPFMLPILPMFIRFVKPENVDFYISSSHAVAKGFRKKKGLMHICYCHTPMRYIWFLNKDYLNDTSFIKKLVLKFVIPFIRNWDIKTTRSVTHFIANSKHIQTQIKEIYNRDSIVIYPPVQTEKFVLNENPRKDFYLAVGRFVSHKKIDVVIKSFIKMKDKKLVLIGNGQDANQIKKLIQDSPNIVWLGYQHDDELILYMQNAKACIFAAKEDFGIMCVEAQATGTPVVALNYGGYQESVIDGVTGYFFNEQTEDSIIQAVEKFEKKPLTNFKEIRENSLRFSVQHFHEAFKTFTETSLKTYQPSHDENIY